MKRTTCMAIGALLLLGVSGATAQSLGDYARSVRKNKPDTGTSTRHYDNDNLPTTETLSVVGPPPGDASAANAKPAAAAPSAAAVDRKKVAEEWKQKLDQQKQKIDGLNHELDLDQREIHLRAVQLNADANVRLRDAGQWDKENSQYKNDVEEKKKALDDARQKLDEMQEQAHKAGVADVDKDTDANAKDNPKDGAPNK